MDVFLVAFLAWTLLSLALGVLIGRSIRLADEHQATAPSERLDVKA